jgi:hypothetical protein
MRREAKRDRRRGGADEITLGLQRDTTARSGEGVSAVRDKDLQPLAT